MRCLEPPSLDDSGTLLVALPRGSYATELLRTIGIELPPDRSARASG